MFISSVVHCLSSAIVTVLSQKLDLLNSPTRMHAVALRSRVMVRNSIDIINTVSIPIGIVEYRYLISVSLSIDTLFRYRYLVLSLE